MKEYQIGEKIKCEETTLQCVEIDKPICDGCFFINLCYQEDLIGTITEQVGNCAESFRSDKKNVVFVEVNE